MRIHHLFWALAASSAMFAQTGIFEGRGDVSTVLHPGSVDYDVAHKTYRVTASGENIWGTADALHYVWKKVSGDMSLTASVSLPRRQVIRIRKPS
jgi:hypothetical protein